MALEEIYNDEYGTVRFETKDRYIYHTFHQPIGGKPFHNILNTGLDTLKQNQATKWLSDDRKNAEFAPEDIDFAVSDWGPRAAQAGWTHWALVVPESIAGRAGMQGIIQAFYNMGVHVAIFTELDEAREWLLER